MKIPGIQYRPVQSLGRYSSAQELAVGRAWANAADQWSGVLAQAANDVAETEAYTYSEQAKREIQDEEARIRRMEVWDTSVDGPLPEDISVRREEVGPGGIMVPRTRYDMHEIQDQLFDSRAKAISEKYGSALEGMPRRMYETKIGTYVTSRRPGIMEDQAKKYTDKEGARLREAVDWSIRGAEWGTQHQALADVTAIAKRGAERGLWSYAEANKMIEGARDEIGYQAGMKVIVNLDGAMELEAAGAMLSQENLLSADNQRKLGDHIERKLTRITAQAEKEDRKRRQLYDARARNSYLAGEIGNEEYVTGTLKNGTTEGFAKASADVYQNNMEGAGISDNTFVEQIQTQLAVAQTSDTPETDLRIAEDMIEADLRSPNPKLRSVDARTLRAEAQRIREAPLGTESFRATKDMMHREIMGYELGAMTPAGIIADIYGVQQNAINNRRFNEALVALRDVMRRGGVRFDAVNWWMTTGSEQFSAPNWEKTKARELGLDVSSVKLSPDGSIDVEGTQRQWRDAPPDESQVRALIRFRQKIRGIQTP